MICGSDVPDLLKIICGELHGILRGGSDMLLPYEIRSHVPERLQDLVLHLVLLSLVTLEFP